MQLGTRFYEQPLLLFILAVLALALATFGIWVFKRTRLFYGMPLSVPLITSPAIREAVVVTVNNKPLEQPHHVEVHLVARGRRDIAYTAFDRQRPLVLDVGAHIYAQLGEPRLEPADAAAPEISFAGTKLVIEPFSIKRRERISLSLLVDGAPRLVCPSPNLNDVVVEGFTGPEPPIGPWPRLSFWLGTAAVLLVFIMAAVLKIAPQSKDEDWVNAVATLNAWLFILWIFCAVTTFGLRRLVRRRH